MFQTGYKGVSALHTGLSYNGGFCELYYTPIENSDYWSPVDPLTQYMPEPSLRSERNWYGPLQVPNDELGFEEIPAIDKGGIYYKQKVYGFHVGDGGLSRVNLENMPYYKYLVVGRQRAGGMYLLIGTQNAGMNFSAKFENGPGVKTTAGSEFAFTLESIYKAQVLTSFLGLNVTPPVDGNGSDSGTSNNTVSTNDVEIITFGNELTKTISWNAARIMRFGSFPLIEVWLNSGSMIQCLITVNAPPPSNTLFTVYTPGQAGYIVIK